MKRLIPLMILSALLGCVQIDDRPLPSPHQARHQPHRLQAIHFKQRTTRWLLRSSQILLCWDPVRLRKYAAMYAGVADVVEKQTNDTVFRLCQAGLKATRDYMGPASQTLGLRSHRGSIPIRSARKIAARLWVSSACCQRHATRQLTHSKLVDSHSEEAMPKIDENELMDFCGWGRRDATTLKERIVEAKREARKLQRSTRLHSASRAAASLLPGR